MSCMMRLFLLFASCLFILGGAINADVAYNLRSMKQWKKGFKNTYMRMSGSDLRGIMSTPNRGYHLFVILSTEDPQAQCPVCQYF